MAKGMSISAVIPCYNEENGISAVLAHNPDSVDEVIVVDNNSTDTTAAVAQKYGATVVKEPIQGYGAAILRGLHTATKEVVVVLDGDGTYSPKYIPQLATFLEENNLDFVSANRFYKGNSNSMPFLNHVGNIILTFFTRLLFRLSLEDSQSGMFMFKRQLLPELALTSGGMSFSQEIKLAALANKHIAFAEYPIAYHAASRIGDKKLRLWHDGFQNLLFLWQRRFTRDRKRN